MYKADGIKTRLELLIEFYNDFHKRIIANEVDVKQFTKEMIGSLKPQDTAKIQGMIKGKENTIKKLREVMGEILELTIKEEENAKKRAIQSH